MRVTAECFSILTSRPLDQNAVSRSAVLAPAREGEGAGTPLAADTIARSSVRRGANCQAMSRWEKEAESHLVLPRPSYDSWSPIYR